ncbi:MAG TPA: alanine--tRNA ligase [bacterium]|mgnify:CR=1 FL=1|nr:alanine--tRNA ligase [bacterium]HPL95449.1 alanine--tRNA ligase [bacterium]
MTSKELRQKYIEFFKKNGHAEIPSASLIPENDPSILFTTAGMSPLVPFLLGEKHPAGARLVNSQKCVRTGDIDEVGDGFHHTFFEMLGHWSIGDYWKEEALKMTFAFVTKELGLDKKFLAVSVFAGDENAPRDDESIEIWKKLGIDQDRIKSLPKKDNWWEPTGNSGPCGPCTEMFYWVDKKGPAPKVFDPSDKRWVEIGNDVLMQYEKIGENKYKPANQKNIDNGTGLERNLAVISGLDDDYQTDLFLPIIQKIEELSGQKYITTPSAPAGHGPLLEKEGTIRSMRIIADHLRAVTFIMGDDHGIAPANVDQGYVVRKLIRRAIRHGRLLGIKENFTHQIATVVINLMNDVYPELDRSRKFVLDNLQVEEEKFTQTLQEGIKEFEKETKKLEAPLSSRHGGMVAEATRDKEIKGIVAFNLFQSFGFPLELTKELAKEKGLAVDESGFNIEMQKHQELSRTAAAGKFKGGLADHSEKVTQYHTATHLLNAALRKVLGPHIYQKGSNITEERMRFDFSHSEKMTAEQIKQAEDLVNEMINKKMDVTCEEMTVTEAKAKGAIGVFADKYGDQVKVYSVCDPNNLAENFSCEICGGPHVKNTGELGAFKIIKEEASSAGVRRIKAVLS